MGTIKVRCIKQYSQLAGMLDIGDEVEIVSILSTEEKVIVNDFYLPVDPKNWSSKKYLASPAVVAPIGNYEGFTFVSKNGKTYSDQTIHSFIGFYKIENLFEKI